MAGRVHHFGRFLKDRPEILSSGLTAGEGSRDILPEHPSGPNKLSCPSTSYIRISHLLDHPDLVQKKAGAFPSQPCPRSGYG